MFVCVHESAHVPVCMYVWKPEMDTGFLPWSFPSLYFETRSFSEPKGSSKFKRFFYLYLPSTEITRTTVQDAWLFHRCQGPNSCLQSKYSMDCAVLPTPRNLFVYSTRNLIQGLHTLGRHITTVILPAKIQKKKKKRKKTLKRKRNLQRKGQRDGRREVERELYHKRSKRGC